MGVVWPPYCSRVSNGMVSETECGPYCCECINGWLFRKAKPALNSLRKARDVLIDRFLLPTTMPYNNYANANIGVYNDIAGNQTNNYHTHSALDHHPEPLFTHH